MNNVLITGGAGFIGSNLAIRLTNSGYNVTVLDSLNPQIHGQNPEQTSPLYNSIKNKVRFILGSVISKSDLKAALINQNIVVHLAAETGTGQSMYEINKYCNVNVTGTSLLLDIITNTPNKVEKLVIASSRAVYGEGKYFCNEFGIIYPGSRNVIDMDRGDFEVKYPNCNSNISPLPTDEESKIQPSSVYGITKYTQELLVMTTTKSLGIGGVALRFQNVYGPGQSLSNPYTGILSVFSTRIRNNAELNIFEDGKESRDFVYIDDAVNATLLGIKMDQANGHVFNVGTGVPIEIRKVASELINGFGKVVPVRISGNYRIGDIRHNYADLTKIENILEFKPKVSFSEGISKYIHWVTQQEIGMDYSQKALDKMKSRKLFK